MSNIAGEIYFIAEEPSVSAPPVRVKIGLVRESKSGRDSQDRLLDHQTGNPRKLKLLEVVETARVSRVENSLHQRYAGQRGIGEWFELSDLELQAAIAECRDLAAQQAVHLPVIRDADAMKGLVRGEVMIPATEDAREWHRRYQVADESASLLKQLIEKYRKKVESAYVSGLDVARYARVEVPRISFGGWLSKHHVAEYEACKQPKTSKPFEVSSAATEPALDNDDAELADEFAVKLDEWSLGDGFESLHRLHLQLRRPLSVWSEEKDLSKAYLKVLCGRDRGIIDICKWTTKTSKNFSAEIAEEKYPLLFEEHSVLEIYGKPKFHLRDGGDGEG
jgi:hypothetical protein